MTSSATSAATDRSRIAPTRLDPSRLDPSELDRLFDWTSPPCLSIYLPTHRQHTGAVQDPVMLRNLLKEARARLSDQGAPADEIDRLLAGAHALIDDPEFWRTRSDGVALFGCDGDWEVYRLPLPVEADIVVGDVVSLRQLAPLFEPSGRLMVLVVDQRNARLFEADRWSLHEIELPDLPDPAAEDTERGALHLRRASAGPSDAAFFHGHGGTKDVADDQRDRFLREVERTVRPILARRKLPLVLGGDTAVTGALRPMLHERQVVGAVTTRPGHLDAADLHHRVWELAAPTVDHARDDAVERYASLVGTGRTAAGADAVAAVAEQGRVDVLLLPPDRVMRANGEGPTVDMAMRDTLRSSGDIVVINESTGFTEPAAILRH